MSDSLTRDSLDQDVHRALIFRLSSLGDLVLSTASLSAFESWRESPLPFGRKRATEVDWVTASEYGILLEGHPGLRQLILYDRRKTGLIRWLILCWSLAAAGHDTVLDLHRNIRTILARVVFALRGSRARWFVVDKQRFRNIGYFIFKSLWPESLRPDPVVNQVSDVVERATGGVARGRKTALRGRPDLRHLVRREFSAARELGPGFGGGYLCVMPGAQWRGKRWSPASYAAALKNIRAPVVVMGGKTDRESIELADELRRAGQEVYSGVGKWSLREVGTVLAHSQGYVGNDTGLAHLAEAVGVPAVIISGPTSPRAGFGPWRAESSGVTSRVWCSPCGKLGKYCFRPFNRFVCLEKIDVNEVTREASRMLREPR